MKKSMLVLAAIAMGVVAHAATVDWQYSVTASAVNYNASNYMLYLIDGAKWDAADKITADMFTSDAVYASTTFAAGTGKGTSKTYVSAISGTTAAGASSTDIAELLAGDTLNVYYVIVDSSKNPTEYYAAAAALTAREATGTAIQSGFGTTTNANVSWTAVQSVPEPTSGLLLLLGMAGLALKRKVA